MRSQASVVTAVVVAGGIALGFTAPRAAVAQITAAAPRTCPIENAMVSVSFNGMETDVSTARTKVDAKMAELKALAQEEGFTKLVVQSHNLNINTNYNGGAGSDIHYQYNGSISFSVLPADKALDFMQALAKKGYQASVNVSSYNNGNGACPQGVER